MEQQRTLMNELQAKHDFLQDNQTTATREMSKRGAEYDDMEVRFYEFESATETLGY